MDGVLFDYAEELSENYGLLICCFDGFTPEAVGGSELSIDQVHIIGTDEFVIVNNSYSSTITYTFQVAKFDGNCQVEEITADEYSQMNRWLNRKEDHKLKFDADSYANIYWIGRFNCKPIKINSKIYGIELTFISTYPYGFEDNIKQICNGKNFTIYNNSDEVGTLYPTVIITCNEAGDLSIENDMDNEIMVIKNCSAGEVITIDSKYKIIFTNDKSHDIYNDFNWNYLKVCNTYDMRFNNYISSLDITIEINYSPVRKVGMV